VYRSVLREACKEQVLKTDRSYNPVSWLGASDDPAKLTEWEAGLDALTGLLFDGAGRCR
jgi:hypothetical protein